MNKWEKLFEEFLDCVDFTLMKHTNGWGVYDRQCANLGDIENDRFEDAEDVLDRMDTYITDYFYADLEDELSAYEVDLGWREVPSDAIGWLLLRNDAECVKKNKKYFDNHAWEFEVLEMMAYHVDEVNLENIHYQEE